LTTEGGDESMTRWWGCFKYFCK